MRAKLMTNLNAGRPAGRGRASIAVLICLCALAGVGLLSALLPSAGAAQAPSASVAQQAAQVASQTPSRAAGVGAPEPTIKTTIRVGGKLDGTVPPPPADAMGTPARSTLVSSDQLYMTRIGADGATFNQWAKVDPSKADSGGLSEQGGYGQESARPLLGPNVATAAGRFLDPVTARVLSLKLTRLGSDGLLTLSSSNQTAEPEWGTKRASPCQAGDSCGFVDSLLNDEVLSWTVDDTGAAPPPIRALTPGGPSGQPATGQQWLVVDAGDGFDQLVNKSDGLCASSPDGYSLLAVACDDHAKAAATQLWRISPAGQISPKAYPNKFVTIQTIPFSSHTTGVLDLEQGGGGQAQDPEYQTFTSVAMSEPGGAIPTWSTLIPKADPATPYAVAAGDLDRVVGSDSQYHDEAVVAYAGPQHHLQVRVIDYNANRDHLLVTAPDVQLPVVGGVAEVTPNPWQPGSVGVAVGSFDGGPLNEIAVTWEDGSGVDHAYGRFHVTLLAYRATADGGRALTVLGDPSGITLFRDAPTTNWNGLESGYAQTVAGDFEGIGRDDLAIAYAGVNPGTPGAQLSGHLGVVSFARDLTVRGQTTFQFSTEAELWPEPDFLAKETEHGVRVTPGLFKYDPAHGYDLGRRELAVAWTEQPGGNHTKDWVQVLDVEPAPDCTDSVCALTIKAQTPVHDLRDETRGGDNQPLALTAGGFEGQGTSKTGAPPLWDIVVGLPPLGGQQGRIVVEKVTDNGFSDAFTYANTEPGARYVLTAYDRAGSSLALGAPLVITVSQLVHANLVAGQPPSHSDWINGQMVNVSRSGFFSVKMGNQTVKKYDYSFTTRPGWNVGVTQSAEIKASATVGISKVEEATGYYGFKEKFAANWSQTNATFSKYQSEIDSSVEQTGLDDDIVRGDFVTYYVYRYPILGHLPGATLPPACNSGPCTPFYEVTIPGQVTPMDDYGKALEDTYQPTWQNGNALSYPPLVGGQVPMPDLGSYSYTNDQGQTVTTTAPLINVVNGVGGGSAIDDLKITGQTGEGHKTDKANNWKLGGEFTAGVKFKGNVGIFKLTGEAKFSVGVSGGQTFSSTDAGSKSNTQASSFELDVPAIDANKGYKIGTAYYNDTAGVAKVVHAVDLTGDSEGREFWQRIYGQHPDPALNLPNATIVTYDNLNQFTKVLFNTNASRQRIRGFYALQPENPNSPLTSGVPYADDPVAGDPVVFSVKVHNYSLVNAPPFPVAFYAVPVSLDGLDVTGPPVALGTVQSLPIPAQGMVTVNAPTWTAQAAGSGAQNWRIFVILDPDNTLNEIHPWKGQATCPADALDPNGEASGTVVNGHMIDPMTGNPDELSCGQNNQGYGQITVMPSSQALGATQGTTSKHKHHRHHHNHPRRHGGGLSNHGLAMALGAAGPPEPAGARLQTSEMAVAGGGGKLKLGATATPLVHLGEQTTIVIHATSATGTDNILPIVIYDGPPSAGHPIATTELDGATQAAGGYATFTLTPDTPGLHTLYEEMLGTDPAENSQQTTQINVLPSTLSAATHNKTR